MHKNRWLYWLILNAILFSPQISSSGIRPFTDIKSILLYKSTTTQTDQSVGVIKGLVLDQMTKSPLAGANIWIEGTRRGTVTDQNGFFSLSQLDSGNYTIVFEFIGYARTKKSDIALMRGQTLDLKSIALTVQPLTLKEIVVTPGSYSIMGSEPSSRQTLSSEDIKIMGWAEDITRALQRIPGISANDFSAKFNIRGGDVDEMLVLLDGMQIYKPYHQKDFGGGLFSTVDIEAISGVDLLTGGFSADYGDRASGVLDMTTKTPKPGETLTSVGLSLMAVRAFSMGSFNENKSSWLFSARRGYLDIINSMMGNEFKLLPSYYDILGKFEHKINNSHTIAIYGFLANDAYELKESVIEPGKTVPNIDFVDTKYGNGYGWLTLKSLFSPQLYARSILYAGSVTQKQFWIQYDDDPNAHFNSAIINDDRDFQLYGIKQDWDFEATEEVFLKFGFDFKKLKTKYTYSSNIENEFITSDDSLTLRIINHQTAQTREGDQIGLFLSARFKIMTPLTLETGLRYDNVSHTNDKLWSPRLGLVYAVDTRTFLRAGWGYFYQSQGIDELNVQFKENLFNPARRAEHFVLGFEHYFTNGLHIRAEGYQKKMTDIPSGYYTFRDIDEFFPEARNDLVKLSFNGATAQGIELSLKYDSGQSFSWWVSYVLSEAKDKVTEIAYDGPLEKETGTLPRPWDQRHTINIDANYRMSKFWHFSLSWQIRSGWPATDFVVKRIAREDGSFAYYHSYGVFRGTRYPSYQRMDVRINRHFYTSLGKISVFLHVINLYNHENVSAYDHEILNQSADSFEYAIESETYFSILPFIGVSWEF